MPTMATASLKNGMMLSRDAAAPDGTVIVPAGTALNGRLRALLASKAEFVEIDAESVDFAALLGDEPPAAGAVTRERLERLAAMFAEHRSDPLMRELCRLAVKCAKEGIIGG